MRKRTGKSRKQIAIKLESNTKMNARITEMRKRTGKSRKQIACVSIARRKRKSVLGICPWCWNLHRYFIDLVENPE